MAPLGTPSSSSSREGAFEKNASHLSVEALGDAALHWVFRGLNTIADNLIAVPQENEHDVAGATSMTSAHEHDDHQLQQHFYDNNPLRFLKAKGGGPALTPAARILVAAFGIVFGLGFCFIMRNRMYQLTSDYFEPALDVKTIRRNKMGMDTSVPGNARVKPLDNDEDIVEQVKAGPYDGRGLYAPETLRAYAMAKKNAPPPSPPKVRKNFVR
ncbi:unnamed protein product [Amoebophrya sp. A120]|nr:unnamed protein product [Amoebophrya sp. A120]|eukprot:GSA120T00023579001.1